MLKYVKIYFIRKLFLVLLKCSVKIEDEVLYMIDICSPVGKPDIFVRNKKISIKKILVSHSIFRIILQKN
jgi:hypothetical protein